MKELSSAHRVDVTYRLGEDRQIVRRSLSRSELAEFDERFGLKKLCLLTSVEIDEQGVITWWWFDRFVEDRPRKIYLNRGADSCAVN